MPLKTTVVAAIVATALAETDCETEYKAFRAAFPEKSFSAERHDIFCANLERIEQHNAANARFTMGLNQFSDWTPDELKTLLGAKEMNNTEFKFPLYQVAADFQFAPEVDWRSRMPAVKNQESCGSCWAFSAIDVVDFYGGSHSEQQLLDCSGGSCQGYNSQSALTYLTSAGSDTESQYPYTAVKGSCHAAPASTTVSNVRSLSGASSIAAAVNNQVVSVSFQLSETGSPFMHYSGGVYDSPCGSGAGHAVAAVGYSGDYWIIRNSWGAGWGVGGYVYFKKGEDLCELESWMPVTATASAGPSPPTPPSPTPPTPPSPPTPSHYHCANDIVTLNDGGWWGCTITPSAPTVFSNVRIQIGEFQKQDSCGSSDEMCFRVHVTCDGAETWYPDAGDCWTAYNGDSKDITKTGAFNCKSNFRMDYVNEDSWAGLGTCVQNLNNWNMYVDEVGAEDASNSFVIGGLNTHPSAMGPVIPVPPPNKTIVV